MSRVPTQISTKLFDFVFVGLGAANSLLILRLHENGLLDGKNIAIIEPSNKNTKNKNFCFWATDDEVSSLKVGGLISKSWSNIRFGSNDIQNIKPLCYHHIRSTKLLAKQRSF